MPVLPGILMDIKEAAENLREGRHVYHCIRALFYGNDNLYLMRKYEIEELAMKYVGDEHVGDDAKDLLWKIEEMKRTGKVDVLNPSDGNNNSEDDNQKSTELDIQKAEEDNEKLGVSMPREKFKVPMNPVEGTVGRKRFYPVHDAKKAQELKEDLKKASWTSSNYENRSETCSTSAQLQVNQTHEEQLKKRSVSVQETDEECWWF